MQRQRMKQPQQQALMQQALLQHQQQSLYPHPGLLAASQCSWGSKPSQPGTSSTPLSLPAAASYPGLSTTDLLAYERSLALSRMGSSQAALMQAQGQHVFSLKQAAMGMGAGGSQALYDGGYQNAADAQQLMFY